MTSSKDKLRIFVLSDLHVFEGKLNGSQPSWWTTGEDAKKFSPIENLKEYIQETGLAVDVLLCPGDMTDKADPECLKHAWEALNNLKVLLKAEHLYATVGNHDVDSRFAKSDKVQPERAEVDPIEDLLALLPYFPTTDYQSSNEFWARRFTVVDKRRWRLLIINSSAFHGLSVKDGEPEYLNGRISRNTLKAVQAKLEQQGERPVNIALMHHHPVINNSLKDAYKDYSHMIGGDEFIDLLTGLDFGDWLIVHGHKHQPKITQAGGGDGAPYILSAGSFSAHLNKDNLTVGNNQFYIVELDLAECSRSGLLKGQVFCWSWTAEGWSPAQQSHPLPHFAGFGAEEKAVRLAAKIHAKFKDCASTKWANVKQGFPDVCHLLPADFKQLIKTLERKYQADISYADNSLEPVSLGFGSGAKNV